MLQVCTLPEERSELWAKDRRVCVLDLAERMLIQIY